MQYKEVESFRKLLILSYFKQYRDYSFHELAFILGLSIEEIDRIVDELINDEMLVYHKNVLRLTVNGRTILQNKTIDHYSFSQQYDRGASCQRENKEEIYLPKVFKGISMR